MYKNIISIGAEGIWQLGIGILACLIIHYWIGIDRTLLFLLAKISFFSAAFILILSISIKAYKNEKGEYVLKGDNKFFHRYLNLMLGIGTISLGFLISNLFIVLYQ